MKLGYVPGAWERPRIPSIGNALKSFEVIFAMPRVMGNVKPAILTVSFP
jgi:hypothetical protein